MSAETHENLDKGRMSFVLGRSETQHEGQVAESRLDRTRFNLWSTIGIQFAVATPPLAITSYTVLIVDAGGIPCSLWAFIPVAVGQVLIAFSLAELGSAYPDASGQVYWTAAVANSPRWKGFLSYLNGAMEFFGWIFACGGGAVPTAQFITSLGVLVNETHRASTWKIYLLVIAASLCAVLFNIILIQSLPALPTFMIVFLNAAALFIFISLLANTHPKASAKSSFLDVLSETGWDSDRVVFFLCIMPGILTICLFDTAAHMAEELPHPERQVPIVMLANADLAVFSALIMVIALIFCTTPPENLTAPLAGHPILQICWDAWPNKGFVITICIIITICLIYWATSLNALTSMLTGCSPHQRSVFLHGPRHSILAPRLWPDYSAKPLVWERDALLFDTIRSSNCLTLASQERLPAQRYCKLGVFGMIVNTLALLWIFIAMTFASFPIYLHVTLDTMNWAPFFLGIVLALSLGNWVLARDSISRREGFWLAGWIVLI
ncbi:amino acid permease-domain-containing protein [Aspergillus insuetus]